MTRLGVEVGVLHGRSGQRVEEEALLEGLQDLLVAVAQAVGHVSKGISALMDQFINDLMS